MKNIYLVFSILIFGACNNSEEFDSDNTINNQDSLTNSVDSLSLENSLVNPNSPSQKFLSGFFNTDFIIRFNELDQKINTISSGEEMKSLWQEAKDLVDNFSQSSILAGKTEKILEEYYHYSDSFDLFIPTCFEECTIFGLKLNANAFLNKAKQTESKHDETYFNYLIIAESQLAETYEEGGSSILGDSNTYTFLKETYPFVSDPNPFYKDYKALRKQYIDNMYRDLFLYNSVQVLKEIDQILTQRNILLETEKPNVREAKEEINTCTTCQFDCLSKGCTW